METSDFILLLCGSVITVILFRITYLFGLKAGIKRGIPKTPPPPVLKTEYYINEVILINNKTDKESVVSLPDDAKFGIGYEIKHINNDIQIKFTGVAKERLMAVFYGHSIKNMQYKVIESDKPAADSKPE